MNHAVSRASLPLLLRSGAITLTAVLLALTSAQRVDGQTGPIQDEGPPTPSLGAEATVASSGLRIAGDTPLDRIELPATTRSAVAFAPRSIEVEDRFDGFGFDDNPTENNGFRFIPPDPIGAASEELLVSVVNSAIEAREDDGDLEWRDSLFDFFAPLSPAARPFDPKILYDHHEDRFVVVALELMVGSAPIDPGNVSRILLAVSKDDEPESPTAADWNYHAIAAKQIIFGAFEGWADYPGFETDEEAVYITANVFTFVPFGFFGGVRLWIVDKGAGSGGFYDGGSAGVSVHNPYAGGGIATTTMPAEVFGRSGVGQGIGTFLVSYSGLTNGVDEFVQVVRVDDPLGAPTFSQQFVNVGSIETLPPFLGLPDAPQAGSPFGIEVNDRRALDCVWRNNDLWLVTTINPESGPDAGETTAHWFRLDTTGVPSAPIVIADQGDIGGEDIAPGTFTFFPAVAVNRRGEAKFGFSASAADIFAGAFVTGRQPNDLPGTVQASQTVRAGEGPYQRFFGGTRNRWGDYSGIALDPDDDGAFWVYNEFADQPGSPGNGSQGPEDGRWGTAWAKCEFEEGDDDD